MPSARAAGPADTFIARLFTLRGSTVARGAITYSGVSADGQSRTATTGSDTEDQVIVPTYLAGDIVFAVRNVNGGTGVSRTVNGTALALTWLDLNVDGRQWAEDA